MRVDQWLPAAHYGDAIGDEALLVQKALRRAGFDSEVYALEVDEEVKKEVLPFDRRSEPGPEDVIILHFALPSPLTEAFRRLRSRKLLIYHNITPAQYFVGLDDELVRIAVKGRQELASLAGGTDPGARTHTLSGELAAAGYRRYRSDRCCALAYRHHSNQASNDRYLVWR